MPSTNITIITIGCSKKEPDNETIKFNRFFAPDSIVVTGTRTIYVLGQNTTLISINDTPRANKWACTHEISKHFVQQYQKLGAWSPYIVTIVGDDKSRRLCKQSGPLFGSKISFKTYNELSNATCDRLVDIVESITKYEECGIE